MKNSRFFSFYFLIGAVVLAIVFTAIVLMLANANPFEAFSVIWNGIFSSVKKFTGMISSWIPLILATSGVLISARSGLWNIGIEGQVGIGAVFATGALRLVLNSTLPGWICIVFAILAGMLGGGIWALIVGAMKTYGGVNEIFGGLGMNFITSALTIWLIFGPWKRPGVGSMSGTEQFPAKFWLPLEAGTRMSFWSLGIAIAAVIFVYLFLTRTYWGLKIKAVGKNRKAAVLFGIPCTKYLMAAFLLSGAFGGLAGAVTVVEVTHRLIPSPSAGIGYTGLLLSMLVNYSPVWVVPVSLIFISISVGAVQLPMDLKLDSSLGGIIQGFLVLFVMLSSGVKNLFKKKI